jgi:predicted amidophosphoribosyltransferase
VIAEHAAEQSGIEVNDVLERTRRTPSQVSLGAHARRDNVKGAIALKRGADVTGQKLVLIDDVITTGSTLGVCAEALLLAGAASVAAITVAREL